MGLTAENVAERWDVSREDMDRFAQRSQERAVAAQDSGFFAREIEPWDGVALDDGPRRESTVEKRLRAFLDAGATDVSVRVVPIGDDREARLASMQRTREFLSSLASQD